MFIINSYLLAVVFCFITMMCWGSWGNTQKLAAKSWRYELFYWDYVIGMVLFALLICFTMGSIGTEGRPFLEDIAQVDLKNVGSIILGGVIFNASNILLSASTSIAGMAAAVKFPDRMQRAEKGLLRQLLGQRRAAAQAHEEAVDRIEMLPVDPLKLRHIITSFEFFQATDVSLSFVNMTHEARVCYRPLQSFHLLGRLHIGYSGARRANISTR